MKDISTSHHSPSEEGLNFIKTFARLYSAEKDNEAEARLTAHWLTKTPVGKC